MDHKGKLFRRLLSGVTAAALAVVCAVDSGELSAFASSGTDFQSKIDEYEKRAEELKEKNEQREAEIDSLSGDIADNEYAMQLIEAQIDGISDEVDAYSGMITAKQGEIDQRSFDIVTVEKNIALKEDEIAEKRVKIAALEKENDENLEKFAQLVRALYMNGSSGTIPILEGSDDWYGFFTYIDVVQNISSQNLDFMNSLLDSIHEQENMIEELNIDIVKLSDDKRALEEEKRDLEDEKAALVQQKDELSDYVAQKNATLSQYAEYNDSLRNRVNNLQWAVAATNDEIEEANQMVAELIRQMQAQNASSTVYSSDGFRWPLDSQFHMITTHFGYDAWRGGNHYGIDVGNAGIGGNNIYAAQGGTVITAYNDGGWHGGYGNYVVIDHGGGLSTLYAHCVSTTVYEGQQVNKGDVVGYVGRTGWATGNHLHFETRVNGNAVDPFSYSYEDV